MFFIDQIGRQAGLLLSGKSVTSPMPIAVLFGIGCSAVVILVRTGIAIQFH
jgi:hypothetical protein